jgi:aspartate-semialdehyde dehydrogenase
MTSFQATSGGGRRAAAGLWQETKDIVGNNSDKEFDAIDKKLDKPSDAFSNQIAFNALPQIGSFKEDDYTSEEWKVVHETHKILSNDDIKITSTCVRIPVFTSHSEAIYFQTSEDADLAGITEVLTKSEGVKFFKTPAYPLAVDVEDKDGVYVGRLRRDPYCKNCFWLWCVADNLRKGAALNAVQIAEELAKQQT